MISIKVNIPDLEEVIHEQGLDILREVTFKAERAMKLKMSDSVPRGIRYERGKGFHVASAPGQPPAIDTSNLLTSIIAEFDKAAMRGQIVMNDYGYYLDQGTVKVKARPWIMPSIDEVITAIKQRNES
jgi:hypothetical protein